jgi:hypothetical protein
MEELRGMLANGKRYVRERGGESKVEKTKQLGLMMWDDDQIGIS